MAVQSSQEDGAHDRRRATLSGLGAIVLWASLAVLTTGTKGMPPFQVLTLTFAVVGVAGMLWLARPGGGGLAGLRQPWAAFALTTSALFGYHALYFIALKRAPAVEANLINYLWPLLIVMFAGFLPSVRVRGLQIVGTVLGLLGAILLVTRGQGLNVRPEYVAGYLAALGAAIGWAAYSVANRRFAAVPTSAIPGACLIVALLGGIVHWQAETWVAPSAGQWGVLLLMGLGPTGAAFLLWDHGTKHGDIAVLGTLSYLAPLLSTLLLLIVGGAQAHWSQAVAITLLLAGAWLSIRGAKAF